MRESTALGADYEFFEVPFALFLRHFPPSKEASHPSVNSKLPTIQLQHSLDHQDQHKSELKGSLKE